MCVCYSVIPDSLRPHGLWPTRLLCPWNFPGKNAGVCCHALPQWIFRTQGSNLGLLCLLNCRWILYHCATREALLFTILDLKVSVPKWLSGKEGTSQCRRRRCRGFDPWVRKIPWSGKWQPTPVFLPGKSHGHRSLVGHSPVGRKESDMTETTEHARSVE